jgi:hypothetical protein
MNLFSTLTEKWLAFASGAGILGVQVSGWLRPRHLVFAPQAHIECLHLPC